MKLLLFGCLLCAVFQLGQFETNEEILKRFRGLYNARSEEEEALLKLKTAVESVCPGYGDKVENTTIKVQDCWEKADETSDTMCGLTKQYGEKCSKPVVDLLEECLPERSKELPKMVVKMVMSGVNYLCGTDGEHILELMNPCFKTQHYQTQRCLRLVRSKIQTYSNTSPSKTEVCDTLSSLRGCLQSHLQIACGSQKTKDAFTRLYDAVKSPCDENKFNELEFVERL